MEVGAPWLIAAVLGGIVAARPLERSLGLRLPGGAGSPAAAAPDSVRVSLDSTPQGAQVIVAPAAIGVAAAITAVSRASPGPAAGTRLGETPLVVTLPRADAAVELQLSKPGFVPLSYKVIPHQDREVIARLEPLPAAPPVVVAPPPRERVRLSSRRGAAAMSPSMMAAKTTRLPSSATAAPGRAAAGPAAAARPGAAPAVPVSARR